MKKHFFLIILLFISFNIYPQEVLINSGNSFLQNYSREFSKHNIQTKSDIVDTLELPFFEDFAVITVYPDPKKWVDKYAFINDTYAMDPITIGVATLDAIDEYGNIYDGLTSSRPRVADYLTSAPINLEYLPADSIYFSFYYQAGGLGNVPDARDSLVLQFKTLDTDWKNIWHIGGGKKMETFKLVHIPIIEEEYLKKGFQFRFFNYATISSNQEPSWRNNVDIWNIDYIMLDKNRSYADTLANDLAFVYNLKSIVKDYESMPWRHYSKSQEQLLKDSLPFVYKNNWNVVNSVERNLYIKDYDNDIDLCKIENIWENIMPLETGIYSPKILLYCDIPKTGSNDIAKFEFKGVIRTADISAEMFRWNDTVRYYQIFDNYYAYDDGTAENGYDVLGNNARLAYRFEPAVEDTLKGVYIYFNRTVDDANVKYFTLTVWDDNNGIPGNIIYEKEDQQPKFANELNKFVFYSIDDKIIVNGPFYVGWQKITNDALNCGFDFNRISNSKLFYNDGSGEWKQSGYSGSLMIRPAFGNIPESSVNHIYVQQDFSIYPNPANDYLNISSEMDFTSFEIYDTSGKMILSDNHSSNINISGLLQGMYYIKLRSEKTVFKTKKFIVVR